MCMDNSRMKNTLPYLISLISTLIFNTAIAGVLTMLMPSMSFWQELIYSQCIGLSVLSINLLVIRYVKVGIARWAAFALFLPLSVALGMTLAFAILGVGGWSDPRAGK